MFGRNSSIHEDEELAEEVRKYPCLFDKADNGYKERETELKMCGKHWNTLFIMTKVCGFLDSWNTFFKCIIFYDFVNSQSHKK